MKLKLDGWALDITFSACHFLPGHGKCNRLHGHNYAIHLELDGEPMEDGLVHDFVTLKSAMKEIAGELDHCILMPGTSDNVNILVEEGVVKVSSGRKAYVFPEEDVHILEMKAVSAETLAEHVLKRMLDAIAFQPNVTRVEVGVDEGRGQGAWVWKEL